MLANVKSRICPNSLKNLLNKSEFLHPQQWHSHKVMGFFPKKVWIIEYYRFMGFWSETPVNQLSGFKNVWDFTG